jgi:hypothetical protein
MNRGERAGGRVRNTQVAVFSGADNRQDAAVSLLATKGRRCPKGAWG